MGFKKYKKLVEKSLPRIYDEDGEPLDRGKIAEKVLKAFPDAEKLDLQPFEPWIPRACGECGYNAGRNKGCYFGVYNIEEAPPDDCPFGYE